jgi:hypothetical protein
MISPRRSRRRLLDRPTSRRSTLSSSRSLVAIISGSTVPTRASVACGARNWRSRVWIRSSTSSSISRVIALISPRRIASLIASRSRSV